MFHHHHHHVVARATGGLFVLTMVAPLVIFCRLLVRGCQVLAAAVVAAVAFVIAVTADVRAREPGTPRRHALARSLTYRFTRAATQAVTR